MVYLLLACESDGKKYKLGERYHPRGDICITCTCAVPAVACVAVTCVKPSCPDAIRSNETCCDYTCLGKFHFQFFSFIFLQNGTFNRQCRLFYNILLLAR